MEGLGLLLLVIALVVVTRVVVSGAKRVSETAESRRLARVEAFRKRYGLSLTARELAQSFAREAIRRGEELPAGIDASMAGLSEEELADLRSREASRRREAPPRVQPSVSTTLRELSLTVEVSEIAAPGLTAY